MKCYYARPISSGTNSTIELKKEFLAMMKDKFQKVTVVDPGAYGLKDGVDDKEIVTRNMNDILTSQLLVADLTVASFGVTVEVMSAINMGMQVIAIVRPGVVSAWISQTVKNRCSDMETLALEIGAWLSFARQTIEK